MIGSTLTTANAVLCVLTMASSLLSAKGDCQTDLASDAFLAFQEAPDNNSTSLAEKAALCETNISVDFDLDMFAVKGIVLCENNALFDEDFYPLCLPGSCTANEDFLDDYLLNMIVSQESNTNGNANDYDVNQCIQNLKYDYIGDGFDPPSYFMCTADYNTGTDGAAGPDLAAFESAMSSGDLLDLAEFQNLCDKVDGFDYFTWSGTKSCADANSDSSTNVEDHPGCLPLSCTSDETILLMMVGSVGDSGCDISAVTFEGLGDSEPGTGSGTGGGSGGGEDECTADYNTGTDGAAGPDLAAFESAAGADGDLDLAELKTMCDKVDGFDYFTWSGTKYCSDANSDNSTNVEDHPGCLPLSCTSNETILVMMVGDAGDAGCDISAVTFEGLGDSEPGTGSGNETGSGDEGNGESGATSIHAKTVAIMITLLGSVLAVVS